jgi:hypothetical protein
MPSDQPAWRPVAAEAAERMERIGELYRRWAAGRISTVVAEEKVREVFEPVVVRVGGPAHTPEVQS